MDIWINKSCSGSPTLSPSSASSGNSRRRSASIPVTPETLRSRFPDTFADAAHCDNFLRVDSDKRSKLPRSAPELTVDEASSGSITPWYDDSSDYGNSLACTVLKPQADVLSRRFSDTLTVSRQHRSRRRKSLSPNSSARPRGHSFPHIGAIRDRSPSVPRDGWYTLRQFCISKGNVVNKGDLHRHRSRSNTSVASSNSSVTGGQSTSGSSNGHFGKNPKRILMLGLVGVGKTSLVNQFMSSDYMNAYDASLEEEVEKNVSMILDGEEQELCFVDPPTGPDTPTEDQIRFSDAFLVVYSVTDRKSFERAVDALFALRDRGVTHTKAVVLVGNKSDLVRVREVTREEAKSVACSYECKFIETSSALNHRVDELLVGIVTQMRLKEDLQKAEGSRKKRGPGRRASSFINRLFGKAKVMSQSCGNLLVL